MKKSSLFVKNRINFFTESNEATKKVASFLFFVSACSAGLFTIFGLTSCAQLQEIDRSYVNQPNANLKINIHSTNSPMTGLRTVSSGGVSCSNCAK